LENLNRSAGIIKSVLLFSLLCVIAAGMSALDITAPVFIVADADNGEILLEKGLSYSSLYSIPDGGTAGAMRPGSSVLGLNPGDQATLITLQRAAAMVSANDAAWTLALISEGNAESFVRRMNNEARKLGMVHTLYTDPDGWSSLSSTTGRDQLELVLHYLDRYPEVLAKMHSLPRMVYQDEDRLANEPQKRNTNLLLGRIDGVDGLKTGTIPSAGFHFIATAERKGTRFVVLVMGIRAGSYVEALNRRAGEAEELLEWAFSNYYSWRPAEVERIVIPVRHGSVQSVSLGVFWWIGRKT